MYCVSVAYAKRSFSSLRIKTRMHCRMSNERLSVLVIIRTHKIEDIDIDSVIDRLVKKNKAIL